ncbi:MAG: hypothetical protein GF404_11400 [candidate division Zixibacteria bacterium]|nr:hypothetical protein [candidate division Zixibacteria bacterium]
MKRKDLAKKLAGIDRRIIFLVVFAAVILPFIVGFPQPIYVSKESRDLYEWVENLPDSSTIILTFDYYPSTLAEVEPMSRAAVKQCWRKHLKLVTMSTVPLGGPSITARVMQEMAEIWAVDELGVRKQYGVDYINLGYKPDYKAVILGMGDSFRKIYPTDFRGTPLDDYPIMQDVDSYDDVEFLFIVSDNGIVDEWVTLANRQFGIPLGSAVTAVMAPKFYSYLQSGQMVGLLGGMKGAAEYEKLIGSEGMATHFMGPQSTVHLVIVLFILIGNVAYFLGDRKK